MADPKTPLRVLIVEDSEDDALLLLRELRRGGYAPESARVESAAAMRSALSGRAWDIILSDYMIPGFGGLEALAIAKESGLDLPFILLSNKASEETLVEAMRAGATDFLMKDRLDRLGPVVKRELTDAAARRDLKQAQFEWRTAFDAVQDAIFIHDAEFRIVRANAAYAALGGLPIAQVAGKRYWEVFPKREGPLPGCRNLAVTGGMVEERIDCADGVTYASRAFAVKGVPGKAPFSVHVIQDITERNRVQEALAQSERHFRSLLEHASDLVAVVDANGLITYISPSVKQLGGYEIDELLGKNYIALAHPEDAPAAAAGYAEIVRNPALLHRTEFRFLRKDGSWTVLESVARNALADPLINGVVINSRDVTERRQAQLELERRERYFRKLTEGSADAFFVIDRAGKVIYRSESGKHLTGYETDEVFGKNIVAFAEPQDIPLIRDTLAHLIAYPGRISRIEIRLKRKDGSSIDVEVQGKNLIDDPDVGGVVVTARDITERKLAKQKLQDSETRYRGIFERAKDVIYMIDSAGIFATLSPSFQQLTGWSCDDWLGKPFLSIVHPDDAARAVEIFKRTVSDGSSHEFEMRIGKKDGSHWTGEFTVGPIEIGGATMLFGIGRDISERKRADAMRAELAAIVASTQDAIYGTDLDGIVTSWNSGAERLFGYGADEMIGRSVALLVRGAAADETAVLRQRALRGENVSDVEAVRWRKDGTAVEVAFTISAIRDARGEATGISIVARDIAERKRAADQLKRLNWALRALSQSNSALVHAGTEEELFQSCCAAIAGREGYPLAWIGLAQNDAARSVKLVAAAGPALAYTHGLEVSWGDTLPGRGPTGAAIRSGAAQVANNLAEYATYRPWLEKARASGLASSISLPIRVNTAVAGALVVYSREPQAFGQPEVELFEELAADIGYGVSARRTSLAYQAGLVEREQATRRLRAAFESLIGVLAATVERRDPYTAGHQRRVAELAAAIARTLGLKREQIEGLHFASTIHDIGKIYVPAEILARPGKLSSTELELVKTHAEVGFEIVKDVEFPWQVAEMIRQHHERIDGSGYPQGLKGDQILLESRILAVADVVEAMSSHRPYRPGLGIDAALSQIRLEAGIKLDAQVVDACERAFREQGFAFGPA